MRSLILICSCLLCFAGLSKSREILTDARNIVDDTPGQRLLSDCNPPNAAVDLAVNNVNTTIIASGDMWWDLGTQQARYEVPKGSGKHIIFAGALWIGGIDADKQLKMAAQTYRQTGIDFWSGPLNDVGQTDQSTCNDWEQLFVVTNAEIEAFKSSGTITPAIQNWPARWNGNSSLDLDGDYAPFVDANSDNVYNPDDGDYPDIIGDEFVWWVFNDNGNEHTETEADPMKIEVHAQAFAFQSSDALDDMTFYRYKVINRSSSTYNNTVLGMFVDPDLGCHLDDFVGCDPGQKLGYCYNGTSNDQDCDVVSGYSPDVPAMGLKFLKTPLGDDDKPLGMSHFIWFNNDGSVTGNPEDISHFYNYLIGRWKDNTQITWGGNGYGGATPTDYMYPDFPCDDNGWSEKAEGHDPGDRRFVMSSGNFTFEPGEVTGLSFVILFAKDQSGNVCSPLNTILNQHAETAQEEFNKYVDPHPTAIMEKDFRINGAVQVTPNPVRRHAVFSLDRGRASVQALRVYDVQGRVAYKKTPAQNGSKVHFERAEDLQDGIYIYHLTDDTGRKHTGKLILH